MLSLVAAGCATRIKFEDVNWCSQDNMKINIYFWRRSALLNLFHFCLKRLVCTSVSVLRTRFVHWTTPLTSSLPLGTLADLARSKPELVAENALLRQQLIILKRQVKQPACTKKDRILLVLLARAVRTWKQTLFLVQPETRLALASWALPPVLEAQVKGLFTQAQGCRGNHRIAYSQSECMSIGSTQCSAE